MTGPLRCCIALESGPCQANPVAMERDGQARCLTHATDALRIRRRDERNQGGGHNRLRTLPKDTPVPRFATSAQVRRFAERMAHLVMTGQLARQVAETSLRAAGLALQVRQLENAERLTDALLRVQHGEAAVMLLARLQDSIASGPRRPLPGRIQALPVSPEQAS